MHFNPFDNITIVATRVLCDTIPVEEEFLN